MNVCLAILRFHSDGMSDYMFILLCYANTMQKGELKIGGGGVFRFQNCFPQKEIQIQYIILYIRELIKLNKLLFLSFKQAHKDHITCVKDPALLTDLLCSV